MWRIVIVVLACLGKYSQAVNRSKDDNVDDAAAYLQASVRTRVVTESCAEGDHVQCPDSGAWCHGMECCPAVGGELNYPCPSAPPGWGVAHCQSSKKKADCTGKPIPVKQCKVGDHVHCGDGDPFHMCAGNQCCPGTSDGLGSYPCPSAEPFFGPGHCQWPNKKKSCLPEHIYETCQYNVDVSGDEVDTGIEAYKTYHKPSADLIHKYRSHIKNTVVNKTCPLDGSTMRNETYPPALMDLIAVRRQRVRRLKKRFLLNRSADVIDCVEGVANAVIDTVGFVLALLGGEAVDAALTEDDDLPKAVGTAIDDFKSEFVEIFEEISKAWKASDYEGAAGSVWKLIDTFHEKIGTFELFTDALKNDLSWWEWVCIGIALVSQLLAWIATDGAEAIIQILADIQTAGSMIDSINSAVTGCSSITMVAT